MYAGQLVFAQLMDHLPWQTFRRIVERYGGDRRVREFSCANQFRCMAFAQLTYRESLRDIETCLRAHAAKLYHLGIRGAAAKSTLADANEARDWRIYAEYAQHKEDAERVLEVLPKRFAKYGLTLHPEKTRLVKFGRSADYQAKV